MQETVFHKILDGSIPCAKIYEDDYILSFMDAFPQSQGHALIIAKQGASEDIFEMDDDILARIIKFSRKLARAQRKVFQPDGIRVMQFNGEAAGQTVFYYHMHLMPVYKDDAEEKHGEKAVEFSTLKAQAEQLAGALE